MNTKVYADAAALYGLFPAFFVYLCIVHKLSFSIVREFRIIVYANLSIKIGGIPFVNKLVSYVGVRILNVFDRYYKHIEIKSL